MILAPAGLALGGEHAGDFAGQAAHAHALADGITTGKQQVGDGLAEQADLGGALFVVDAPATAFSDRP